MRHLITGITAPLALGVALESAAAQGRSPLHPTFKELKSCLDYVENERIYDTGCLLEDTSRRGRVFRTATILEVIDTRRGADFVYRSEGVLYYGAQGVCVEAARELRDRQNISAPFECVGTSLSNDNGQILAMYVAQDVQIQPAPAPEPAPVYSAPSYAPSYSSGSTWSPPAQRYTQEELAKHPLDHWKNNKKHHHGRGDYTFKWHEGRKQWVEKRHGRDDSPRADGHSPRRVPEWRGHRGGQGVRDGAEHGRGWKVIVVRERGHHERREKEFGRGFRPESPRLPVAPNDNDHRGHGRVRATSDRPTFVVRRDGGGHRGGHGEVRRFRPDHPRRDVVVRPDAPGIHVHRLDVRTPSAPGHNPIPTFRPRDERTWKRGNTFMTSPNRPQHSGGFYVRVPTHTPRGGPSIPSRNFGGNHGGGGGRSLGGGHTPRTMPSAPARPSYTPRSAPRAAAPSRPASPPPSRGGGDRGGPRR